MTQLDTSAVAYVNHGRWVVDCPTPYCNEAHLAGPVTCDGCSQTYSSRFPADAALIDAVLSRRVVVETRNWLPGETVQDLEAENEAHRHEGVVV
jgi:hypothetical protein